MPEHLFPQPLLDMLASDPDTPAFEHGTAVVSRGELLSIVRQMATAMRAAGLGRGTRVALLTDLTVEGFAVNVAAHALGCVVVGIRPNWSRAQLVGVLRQRGDDSGDGIGNGRGIRAAVDAVVGDSSTLTTNLQELSAPATMLSLGPHPGVVDLLDQSSHGLGGGDFVPLNVEARPDDLARVNFTSGSTGRPKGCVRSYRCFGLAYLPERWAPDLRQLVTRCERFLIHVSWSHPVMLTFAARCLTIGGTVVLRDHAGGGPPTRQGDLPDLATEIARHRITATAMTVPMLHQMLVRLSDDPGLDVGSLQALVVTGSPASPGLLAAAVERLGPVVWQGYGQAEAGMISLLTPDDIARSPEAALASVGRPLPDVEIRVRDADDRPVGPGRSGEIWVRSPHVMAGYWNDAQATREVLGDDGWLRTRDLGRLDADGLLHLTGRSRDVIMVDAELCYAGAIEQVLGRHPDVDQAYVVGVPDERTGEAIHAFVVPRVANGSVDRGALVDLVRSELTPAHTPRTVTTLSEIPTATSGKPDKQALANMATRHAR